MRFLKYVAMGLGGLVGLVLLFVGGAVSYISLRYPEVKPPSNEKVEITPERISRGKYLVENVSACFSCHSERDWEKYDAPTLPGSEGGPGFCISEMGSICVPNITPDPTYGIGAWSDGEVIRAIREGIGRDGRALTSVMPFSEYRAMSDEDVRSVVAYLRSLPPIKKGVEKPLVVAFPLSVISKIFPKPVEGPQATPAPGSPEYGKYLVNVAGCAPCHGSDPFTKTFEGGFDQSGPWGHAVGRNITPDMDTGIGIIPREAFIGRFKSHLEVDPAALADPSKGSPMPWGMFAGMSEEDLGAIYDYLRTVKPVKNAVVP